MNNTASVSHEDATAQEFKDNPQEAAEYLSAVLHDGDQEEVLLALRRIATAFGQHACPESSGGSFRP